MKRLISLIILCVMCFCCLFGCAGNDNTSVPSVSQEVAVSSISLSKTSITMVVGDKTAISATIKPSNATNKKITWSSTNSNVADYINGEIYALGEGSCIIKATTTNGITGVCNVKVEKAPVYAESVVFPENTYYLNIGQECSPKLQISPQALDSYKGTISFSKNNIVSATYSNDNKAQLTIVGLSEGETIITVTLDGGEKASAKVVVIDCSKYVKINVPNTPLTVSRIYRRRDYSYTIEIYTYETQSSARIDSINIYYTYYDKNTIRVDVEINGTKTYDVEGGSATKISYYMALFKENNVLCVRENLSNFYIAVGETFTNSYTFAVSLDDDMTAREFTLEFSDYIY